MSTTKMSKEVPLTGGKAEAGTDTAALVVWDVLSHHNLNNYMVVCTKKVLPRYPVADY